MSPARRRLPSVRAVAERLLRGTPRKGPQELLREALDAAVPGILVATLHLTPADEPLRAESAPTAPGPGTPEQVIEPWLEPDPPEPAGPLERVVLRLDPALFTGAETALPGPALAPALAALGWTAENGLDGAVRDDVDSVSLHRPDETAPQTLRELWAEAEAASRDALATGAAPGGAVALRAP